MNLFQKAAARLNLTPTERAILKLIESLIYVAGFNVIVAAAQYIENNQQINWAFMLKLVIAQAILAVVMALSKYFKAQGDPAIAAAIDSEEQNLAKNAPAGVNPVIPSSVNFAPPTQTASVSQPVATPASIEIADIPQEQPAITPDMLKSTLPQIPSVVATPTATNATNVTPATPPSA
jgi:hypothetical protein